MEEDDSDYYRYAREMRQWRLTGADESRKPRVYQQTGSHIDSLPVEPKLPPLTNKICTVD